MINLDLEKQITAQIEQTIKNYINSDDLQNQIKQQIDAAVTTIIDRVSGKIYVDVINENNLVDSITKIVQQEARQNISTTSLTLVRQELDKIPVTKIIEDAVQRDVDIKFNTVTFPEASINCDSIKWKPNALNGSYIHGGRINKFKSLGIDDDASDYQLKLVDGHVIVENELSTPTLNVTENLNVNNISILGTLEIGTDILDHGPFSQMIQMHSQMMIEQALEPYTPLLKDGTSLITDGALSNTISYSNLRRVGNLQELNVIGDGKFSETMFIGTNGKVGINTDEPRGALTVRDEEAEITFARTRRHTMFVGSTRTSEIELGTNNQSQMILKENQIDITTPIRVMGIKFSAGTEIPEHNGELNEIVMVTNAREDQAIFYICRGGKKWQAMGI